MKHSLRQKHGSVGLSMLRSGVFIRTFLILLLVAALPAGLLAFAFSQQLTNMWKNETHDLYIKELGAITNSIDQQLQQIDNESFRIATSNNALLFIVSPSFANTALNTSLTQNLSSAVAANAAIDSIYLCSTFENLILSSDNYGYTYFNFYDKAAVDLYREDMAAANYCKRSMLTSTGERKETVYYSRNIPYQSIGQLGCVIINIDLQVLFSNLSQKNAQMELIVLDRDGNLVYTENEEAEFNHPSVLLDHLGGISQSYPFMLEGREYIAFQNQSYQTGWTFIGIAPLSLFNQRVNEIINLGFVLMSGILLLCLSLAFPITKNLYQPLHNLVGEITENECAADRFGANEYDLIRNQYSDILRQSRDMEEYLREARPAVKEWMFYSLIMGDEWDENDIANKISFIGDGFSTEYYAAIILRIIDQKDFQMFDTSSRNQHFVTLLDICSTAVGAFPHVIVRTSGYYEWTIALNTGNIGGAVQEIVQKITWQAAEQFPFRVALGAGRVYRKIKDLPFSYQEAIDQLRFRLYIQGEKSLTDASGVEYGSDKFEAKIIAAIRSGDVQKADILSKSTMEVLLKQNEFPHGLHMACANLLNRVIELLISLDIDPTAIYDPHQYYDRLSASSTPEEMQDVIQAICIQSARFIDCRNGERVGKTVEKLIDYIDQHMGEDISLQSLSEYIGLSTTYVSRIIKEHLQVGFVEYLNSKRIDRAKKLLADTQINVEQIGFQVGFNNVRSFMRAFKQYEGISPGSYRIKTVNKTGRLPG